MGIEPKTFRLQSECSTTKLKEHTREENKHIICLNLSTEIYKPNLTLHPNPLKFLYPFKANPKLILANVLSNNKTHPGNCLMERCLHIFIVNMTSYLKEYI